MNQNLINRGGDHIHDLFLYALRVLSPSETAAAEAHIAACPECRQELDSLLPVMDSFVSWPSDVLRPRASLWGRLADRISQETGQPAFTPPPQTASASRPQWEEVAPGIAVQILATDAVKQRVSMLVRLAPGTDYPPHRHADLEELHLLSGELTIDDKRLYPGDYIRADAGSVDERVWSETGCTCFLMTSTKDRIL